MKPLTFEEWLRENGYHSPADIRERVIVNGGEESDVDAETEPLHNEYEEYLEEFGEEADAT